MDTKRKRPTLLSVLTVGITLLVILFLTSPPFAWGQLQISEIMFDPGDDGDWEWFEIRNSGTSAVDLDGFFVDDTGGDAFPAGALPNIQSVAMGGNALNTVIPAGSVAVLYDGAALAFDDSRFRSAWRLSTSVPLISVNSFPGLNNDGDSVGLWANKADYDLDVGDGDDDGDLEIVQFTNSTVNIEYGTALGFPGGNDSASIAWSSNGSFQDGAEWTQSADMVSGAKTSVQTFLPGMDQLNNTDDTGSPGRVPGGTPPASTLLMTEIMYNPASSPDNNWEWIEVFNNTGATIDFSATPFVLDDVGGDALTEANITTGTLGDGEAAVLFNSGTVTVENMEAAWGSEVNFIPVSNWSALNNGGDTVGIWDSFGMAYMDDKQDEIFDGAIAAVAYDDDGDIWPADNSQGSVALRSLDLDPSDGTNWVLSLADDGTSVNANAVFSGGQPIDHPGGDVGSPGFFPGDEPPIANADFNGDEAIDCGDIDLLYAELSAGGNDAAFDLNGDMSVDDGDVSSFLQEAADARGFASAISPGDTDFNGKIEASDLNTLGINWLRDDVASWCEGDFNHDQLVNAADLNDIGLGWLSDVTVPAAASSATVPEPSACGLLAMAGLLLGRWRRTSGSV